MAATKVLDLLWVAAARGVGSLDPLSGSLLALVTHSG